jgi:hypothetical protein
MITKHCVRWSLSLCPKQAKGVIGVQGTVRAEPLTLQHGSDTADAALRLQALRDARGRPPAQERAAAEAAGGAGGTDAVVPQAAGLKRHPQPAPG